ncbi:hypothetical protein QTG56_24180 (plasmid) [Rossellomorea sp. AcN35-11]|nr:hypothetical protein [Rossellomorea aquimaris]WJV31738.1 hypothetical protein QTG56_24180 [Rossellomorea sp. AcN35-11]
MAEKLNRRKNHRTGAYQMDVFSILNWFNKHKTKFLVVAWAVLLTDSAVIIYQVMKGTFEMFGVSTWGFILGLINWSWTQMTFGEET